jgi:hypothetical protein
LVFIVPNDPFYAPAELEASKADLREVGPLFASSLGPWIAIALSALIRSSRIFKNA